MTTRTTLSEMTMQTVRTTLTKKSHLCRAVLNGMK